MSLLQEFINCDKQLTSICDFLNANQWLEGNNRMGFSTKHFLARFSSKISVFEENNKIYKVLNISSFRKLQAIEYLTIKILDLSQIVLPYDIEYVGEAFAIISQEKIKIIQSRKDLTNFFDNKTTTCIINSNKIDGEINQILALTLPFKDYEKFLNFIELLKIRDLININNFGIDKNNKIKCVDLESFNESLSINELKEFLSKFKINFSEVINSCPEVLSLITEK